jgi:hypothetical protein
MPLLREQLLAVLANPQGYTSDHRAAILEDAMRYIAREEIEKAEQKSIDKKTGG